jgi:tetratricopeptide (TPR) repeat protein
VKLYKLAGDDERTIQACRESAVCHDELGQFLTTATDLETAGSLLAKDGSEANRKAAFDCFRESGVNYRKNNSYEKAAGMKAADVMEAAGDQALALEALQEACGIFEDEQRGQFHDSTFKLAIGKAVKWGRYDAAIAFMRRQTALVKEQQLLSTFASDVHKNYLQVMVLLLQQGEVQAAREEFEQAEAAGDRFPQSDQYPAAAALVDAYDAGDSEKLGEALKLTPFKYIMNSIAVIARKLQMSEGKKQKKSRKTDAPSAAAEQAAEEDEKDEDDFT